LTHPDGGDWEWGWNSMILRSLVIDNDLFTVSNAGVMQTSLTSFETLGFVELIAG